MPAALQVVRCEDPASFLERTLPLRTSDPIRTNVIGSVATQVDRHPDRYERCLWWVVFDGQRPVGLAMRTVPLVLALGPMPDAAARALAPAVLAADADYPGIAGFRAPVGAFLGAAEALGGRGSEAIVGSHDQLVYECAELRVPTVTGEAVVAEEPDLPLVDEWIEAFHHESEHPARTNAPRSDADRAATRRTVEEGRIMLWRVDGEVVSLAGEAVPVATPTGEVARVGPVYTPPSQRRRGYGGAVTAAVTARALGRGARVMLFTDAANPTSNHVYQDLGYELVDEYVVHFFERP